MRRISANSRDLPRPASAVTATTAGLPARASASPAAAHVQLLATPDHRQHEAAVALVPAVACVAAACGRATALALALHGERIERRPVEAVTRIPGDRFGDIDRPGWCLAHQSSGDVDRIADTRERPAVGVATGTAEDLAGVDPDLHPADPAAGARGRGARAQRRRPAARRPRGRTVRRTWRRRTHPCRRR